ncbi:MAG: hypothetical protein GXN95_03500 [Methanococci archaeon]|nr:hypothetical protein [Methanococci archaeon]
MDVRRVRKMIASVSLIFGCSFIISGFVEMALGVGKILGVNISLPLFVGDVFGGLALLAVGITYMIGVKKAIYGDIRAVSYLFTASIVGLGIGIVAFLVLISHGIGFLLGFEEWSPLKNITIYLILGVLAVIPYKISEAVRAEST